MWGDSPACATSYFRYSTNSSIACSSGTKINMNWWDSSTGNYYAIATGLTPNTTYYFCSWSDDRDGTPYAHGALASFTTSGLPPVVVTGAESAVTSSSATLNGTIDPNGAATTGYYRYNTPNPSGVCSSIAVVTSGTSAGSGQAAASFPRAIASLLPNTLYYYCIQASNAFGTDYGGVGTFTTSMANAVVTTQAPTSVGVTYASLHGTIDNNHAASTNRFRWGTTNVACASLPNLLTPAGLGANYNTQNYSMQLTGLTVSTRYYYCAEGYNGTNVVSRGSVTFFDTGNQAPVVTTDPASGVSASGGTLNGTVDPNNDTTTVWFRYNTVSPGATCNDTFGTKVPFTTYSDNAVHTLQYTFTGQPPNVTYYYCWIASNSVGLNAMTPVQSFTTSSSKPTVTTDPATNVGPTQATVNGTVYSNNSVTSIWIRYGSTNPGTCNDTFGAVLGPYPGYTGLGPHKPLVSPGGLTPGTTYYYCVIANNAAGTSLGNLVNFTTTATAPTVVTSAATNVGQTQVTFNGTVNPNNSVTSGWFRYSSTNPGACNDTFGTVVGPWNGYTGSSPQPFVVSPNGLTPGTTYYYCLIANNAGGTTLGNVVPFTTQAAGNTQCSDLEDNDGDGKVDMADPNCTSASDDTENSFTAPTLLPTPTRVRIGDYGSLTWDTGGRILCYINGPGSNDIGSPSNPIDVTGSASTPQTITRISNFVLTCTDDGVTTTKTATIQVLPTVIEI
jgi:hypothetical protein